MNVSRIKNFETLCNGCTACYNICPKSAITMIENTKGFLYPFVNEKQCVECNKCVDVCSLFKCETKGFEKEYYTFYSTDDIRMKSSSGGLFYHLAQDTLSSGGVVFGAAYSKAKKSVHHVSTYDCELEEIMRSKYVQSDVSDTFKKVKEALNEEREVLFSGTPCQVSGLKNFLGREYENLLTVDFVCHGVPSPGLFRDYLEYQENNKGEIVNVTFREKNAGWRKLVVKHYYADGKAVCAYSLEDDFFKLFINNLSLRNSCFYCEYPSKHCSDITMFDYWQSKTDDDKGISGVLINTPKGKHLFDKCTGEKGEIDKTKVKRCFISHKKLPEYSERKKFQNDFFEEYERSGYEKAITNTLPLLINKLKKKGIIASVLIKGKRSIKRILRK